VNDTPLSPEAITPPEDPAPIAVAPAPPEAQIKRGVDAPPPPDRTQDVAVTASVASILLVGVVFFVLGILIGRYALAPKPASNALPANFEAIIRDAVADGIQESGVMAAVNGGRPVEGQRYTVAVAPSDEDPYLGNPDAAIQIIEFSDFTCGYCGRFARDTLPTLVDEFGDQIKITYIDYPFLSEMSYPAALAGECAHDQGRFWEYHDTLFNNQSAIVNPDALIAFADELGFDMDAFNACMDGESHRQEIVDDLRLAENIGQLGTPAFFVNGRFVSGAQPIEVFRTVISEELARLETIGS
jgi:protein-disulfide isomerase